MAGGHGLDFHIRGEVASSMRGRLIDLSFAMNGKQRLTVELDGDFRKQFDRFKDIDVRIEIKKYRKKRSKDANAYAWVLIDRIAAALSLSTVPKQGRGLSQCDQEHRRGIGGCLCFRFSSGQAQGRLGKAGPGMADRGDGQQAARV